MEIAIIMCDNNRPHIHTYSLTRRAKVDEKRKEKDREKEREWKKFINKLAIDYRKRKFNLVAKA